MFDDASQWPLEDWISTLAQGGGAKKLFQYCLNPNSPNQFLYLRAFQWHSRESAIDPALQDIVLLPKGFTEYIHHVGNASELNSIIRNGLIPGGKSLKRGRQAVFFMIRVWRNPTRLDETKDRAIQEYLETSSKYGMVVQFEAPLGGRIAILPNTVTCSRSPQHTTCSLHWESGMYVNRGWALPEGSPNSVVLKSNQQCGPQDPRSQDARSSWEPSSDSKSYGETCNCVVDCRIPGVPLSTGTGNPSFRTWARRRTSTSSAKSLRNWSPTLTTPRSSNFAKSLPNSNVLNAMPTGISG